MSTLTEQRIGSFETTANRQWTEVACPLSRRSWGGTRDKPKNVCVGGYGAHSMWKSESAWYAIQFLSARRDKVIFHNHLRFYKNKPDTF